MAILIVTARRAQLAEFIRALAQETGLPVAFAGGYAEAEVHLRSKAPQFMLLDQDLPEGEPLALAKRTLGISAMVNVAVVSPLGHDAFHEAGEGLGILAPVPVNPTAADGEELARVFKKFM